jgi:hypothetical protein
MRRSGHLCPVASYRWSAARRSAGAFGRVRSTAGDALKISGCPMHRASSPAAPKCLPKCETGEEFRLGAKTSPHRRPQNRIGAGASSINEPALPCRPMCGRILSGAPAPRGSTNPMPGASLPATPPLSRRILPPETSHRFLSRRYFPPRSRLPAGRQL